ncbi:MAG: type II/IV secretion system ATPase subunit [Nanobdellota archaeon]
MDLTDKGSTNIIEKKFREKSHELIEKYLPDADDSKKEFLVTYLVQKSLGFGNMEILLDDPYVEEIVINGAKEPIWIYHKKHGWVKSDIVIGSEEEIKRYATMVGRRVGRQISVLEPLLDAHLEKGSRVNATLTPISINGNTMTFRKFSSEPMTITHFLEFGTISPADAALIWQALEYEMSMLISGGTASGKTSMLNVIANFFPPNQRILSIEDTREIRLPKYLHWVPMMTRLPNAEGKGEVKMSDLLVNSLRMRPDRLVVGEVRRKKEIETLFEAIHTGHSCYSTIHANDAEETINRLVNKPFEVPRAMLPAVSLIITQFRNRRTGVRRTFQIAEVNKDGTSTVLRQYNPKTDKTIKKNKSKTLMDTLKLFSGLSEKEIEEELKVKEKILKYLVKNKIKTVDEVGKVIAEYNMNRESLLEHVKKNKLLED